MLLGAIVLKHIAMGEIKTLISGVVMYRFNNNLLERDAESIIRRHK